MSIFPIDRLERETRKREVIVGECRKERELAAAVSSDRSADRTLLRRSTGEKSVDVQVRKRGGVLAGRETIEGTENGQLS